MPNTISMFKVGDIVIFERGWNGRQIEREVGGREADYVRTLTDGCRIAHVNPRGNTVALDCGWNVRPYMIRLKEARPAVPEPPPEWAARWNALLTEK